MSVIYDENWESMTIMMIDWIKAAGGSENTYIMMTNTRQRIIILSITILLNLISSIATTTATQWWTKQTTTHSKTIIAYYASWQWYDRDGLAAPKNLDHSKVTRYNFAFFQINTQGDIWGTGKLSCWQCVAYIHGSYSMNEQFLLFKRYAAIQYAIISYTVMINKECLYSLQIPY